MIGKNSKDQGLTSQIQPQGEKIHRMVYLVSVMTFFSILAPALLHSNDKELFTALFSSPINPLSELTIIKYSSLYDSIYYVAFIVGLIIGPFSDKKGKRKVFIIIGSFGFLLFSTLFRFSPNFQILLLFRLFQGISHILVWQTLMVLVYDYSGSNVAKSVSINTIFMGMAMGSGTMLGGFLANFGTYVPIYVSIGSYSIVFLLAILILKDPKFVQQHPTIKQSIFLAKEKPHILVPALFNFIDRLHMGFLIALIPLYLTFVIPLEPSMRGMIFGLSAIPSIILSYPVGRKSDGPWGRIKPLALGSIIYGVLLSLTGIVAQDSLVIFIIFLMFQGCAQGLTMTPNNSLLGDIIEPEHNAMAVSIFNFFGNIGMILGPIFGLIFGRNYSMAFLVAGIIEILSLIFNIFLARKLKVMEKIGFQFPTVAKKVYHFLKGIVKK
ncbi:MFS transporter [Promethearchaeum syntrophicum]|uniref:MFS transporter n=1 Tax=Promethearchaeum syntrophicum TaxID=2594042 RepID=A0A5B9D5X5_9ARCH|nr:MFS transporter [Candidatus Prometheoarchaeum syntrophicum]QEE14425.1 Major Facilitator Superfamily protein [Candidatus Prometheoarchaeum syntrophicum]